MTLMHVFFNTATLLSTGILPTYVTEMCKYLGYSEGIRKGFRRYITDSPEYANKDVKIFDRSMVTCKKSFQNVMNMFMEATKNGNEAFSMENLSLISDCIGFVPRSETFSIECTNTVTPAQQ